MSSIKSAALWVSAAFLIACLSLFFGVADADVAAPAKATASAVADQAPAQFQQSSAAPSKAACGAEAKAPLSLSPLSSGPVAMACPTNTSYTCCPCGGCGCRPRHISPINWCQCF